MKIDAGSKEVLIFAAKWFSFLAVLLFVEWYFDLFIGNEIVDQPLYYCTIAWCLYACLSAKFEAYYYNYASQDNSPNKPNLHMLFTFIRGIVIIPILILTSWKAVLCYIVMFPFFHDGAYYAQREKIKPGTYPKKWFAQSATSTAKMDIILLKLFSPKTLVILRIVLAAISIGMVIVLRYKYT